MTPSIVYCILDCFWKIKVINMPTSMNLCDGLHSYFTTWHDSHGFYGGSSSFSWALHTCSVLQYVQTKVSICKCRNRTSDIKMSFFLYCEGEVGSAMRTLWAPFNLFFFFSLILCIAGPIFGPWVMWGLFGHRW